MNAQLAERAAQVTDCAGCGQPVLRVYSTAQSMVTLDAEQTLGAIYVIDQHGRARRRTLVELYRAERAHRSTPGYDPHDCVPLEWFQR